MIRRETAEEKDDAKQAGEAPFPNLPLMATTALWVEEIYYEMEFQPNLKTFFFDWMGEALQAFVDEGRPVITEAELQHIYITMEKEMMGWEDGQWPTAQAHSLSYSADKFRNSGSGSFVDENTGIAIVHFQVSGGVDPFEFANDLAKMLIRNGIYAEHIREALIEPHPDGTTRNYTATLIIPKIIAIGNRPDPHWSNSTADSEHHDDIFDFNPTGEYDMLVESGKAKSTGAARVDRQKIAETVSKLLTEVREVQPTILDLRTIDQLDQDMITFADYARRVISIIQELQKVTYSAVISEAYAARIESWRRNRDASGIEGSPAEWQKTGRSVADQKEIAGQWNFFNDKLAKSDAMIAKVSAALSLRVRDALGKALQAAEENYVTAMGYYTENIERVNKLRTRTAAQYKRMALVAKAGAGAMQRRKRDWGKCDPQLAVRVLSKTLSLKGAKPYLRSKGILGPLKGVTLTDKHGEWTRVDTEAAVKALSVEYDFTMEEAVRILEGSRVLDSLSTITYRLPDKTAEIIEEYVGGIHKKTEKFRQAAQLRRERMYHQGLETHMKRGSSAKSFFEPAAANARSADKASIVQQIMDRGWSGYGVNPSKANAAAVLESIAQAQKRYHIWKREHAATPADSTPPLTAAQLLQQQRWEAAIAAPGGGGGSGGSSRGGGGGAAAAGGGGGNMSLRPHHRNWDFR